MNKNAELTTALGQIRAFAVKGELTGSFNRRYLSLLLAQQKAMADRREYAFSFFYVDLDSFKRVNDWFGHSISDAELQQFTVIARQVMIKIDCVTRAGGEEFALVRGGTSERDARAAADCICIKTR